MGANFKIASTPKPEIATNLAMAKTALGHTKKSHIEKFAKLVEQLKEADTPSAFVETLAEAAKLQFPQGHFHNSPILPFYDFADFLEAKWDNFLPQIQFLVYENPDHARMNFEKDVFERDVTADIQKISGWCTPFKPLSNGLVKQAPSAPNVS